MKRTKSAKKALEAYAILGKTLCGCAGAIVGFVLGGPVLMIPLAFAGILASHFLAKTLIPAL